MSIIRYNSSNFTPVLFRDLIDACCNDLGTCTTSTSFVPRADAVENKESFIIHVEVPGMSKDDFKVELQDNFLTVSGNREDKTEKKEANYHLTETRYGAFSRSFALPEEVQADKVKAQYNNGILELTIPKSKKKEPKQIAITVS